jgi:hypothetical protein
VGKNNRGSRRTPRTRPTKKTNPALTLPSPIRMGEGFCWVTSRIPGLRSDPGYSCLAPLGLRKRAEPAERSVLGWDRSAVGFHG